MIDFYTLQSKFYVKDGELTSRTRWGMTNRGQVAKPDHDISEFLAFSTKDEYLAWAQQWRETYAELSKEIRRLRKEWRAEGQTHSDTVHYPLLRYREMARVMLPLRAMSKQRAEQLYQAAKEASQVA